MSYRYQKRLALAGSALALAVLLMPTSATSAVSSNSTTGTSNAEVLSPLSINVINPFLAFGLLSPSDTPGTVVITANGGSVTRSTTGGVTVFPGPFGASVFFVTGQTAASVTVALPPSITVTSGANSMLVDTLQSSPPSPYTQPAGGQFLSVGGTLHVAANQPAGNYSATYNVSVNY